MFRVPQHIWRTNDGVLVPHGHPDAAFLAYPAGEELSDHDAKARGLLSIYPAVKSKAKPMDKAVAKSPDKGGLTITRLTDQKGAHS